MRSAGEGRVPGEGAGTRAGAPGQDLGGGAAGTGVAGRRGVRSACGRGGAAVVTSRSRICFLRDQARGAGGEGEVGEPV